MQLHPSSRFAACFRTRRFVEGAALVALVAACSEKPNNDNAAVAAIASSSLAVRAPASVVPVAAPAEPPKPALRRPNDAADLLLTDERRARIERLAPEARGFLTSAEVEERLYKLNLKRGKDADGLRALDGIARGKWILFTGNIGGLAKDGFELPIRYTPKDPADPMGLTSTWLSVKFSDVKSFDASQYKPGELAVILAKYEGKKEAKPGYDVVLLGDWF